MIPCGMSDLSKAQSADDPVCCGTFFLTPRENGDMPVSGSAVHSAVNIHYCLYEASRDLIC